MSCIVYYTFIQSFIKNENLNYNYLLSFLNHKYYIKNFENHDIYIVLNKKNTYVESIFKPKHVFYTEKFNNDF